MNPEVGHLYHDSHFSVLSGAMLEAREHLKARQVNAREQRLLHHQDQRLQQAKETCRRRSSWEQDNVRRHLRAILERTPTFDRSLKQEWQKMKTGQQGVQDSKGQSGMYNSHPEKLGHKAGESKAMLSTRTCQSSPRQPYPMERACLPPIGTKKVDVVKTRVNKSTSSLTRPKQRNRAMSYPTIRFETDTASNSPIRDGHSGQPEEKVKVMERDRLLQIRSIRRGHRHSLPEQVLQTTLSPGAVSIPSEPGSHIPNSPLYSDMSSPGHHKGALLRRRSHHAIMAIMRVQARHEQRMHEAEVAMTHGMTADRQYKFPDQSSTSLSDLPSMFSHNVLAHMDHSRCSPEHHPPAPTPSDDFDHPKLSWLSLPISHKRHSIADVSGAGDSVGDNSMTRPARTRFYSVD